MFEIEGHLGFQRDSLSTDTPCATRVERDANGLARKEIRLYNAYASAIPVYQPCLVRYDGDEETNPFVVSGASASGAIAVDYVVVPQKAVPASSWGWFTIAGYCTCLVDGTTDVAKDHFLCASVQKPGGLSRDGTGTVPSVNKAAIAREAQTTNSAVAIAVYLLGDRVAIAEDVS